MDTAAFRQIIGVIRTKGARRKAGLPDHPDAAHDRWLFTDQPFVNELCLLLLVRLSHEVERQLLLLSLRMPKGGVQEIDVSDYRKQVGERRELLRKNKGKEWRNLYEDLGLRGKHKVFEVLRLLADSYKHDPFMLPDQELLSSLGLPRKRTPTPASLNRTNAALDVNYAPLSESSLLQQGLARCLSLHEGADYCDIAEAFVNFADKFLAGITKGSLTPLERKRISMNPRNFEH